MKCVDSFFSRKGVTLVELMISVAVIGIVVLTAGHYFSESQMPNLRISNVVSGDALAREFFNLQKKRLLSSTDMVPTVFSNPVNATTFSGATISFNNVAGTGVGRVSTTCVDLPGGIAPLEDNALNEINACLPGGMRCRPDQVPVIREGGNRLFPRGAGDGRDGNPVGAAICFTLDGNTVAYRNIKMKLITLILSPGSRTLMARSLDSVIPRPKVTQSDSIQIRSVIPQTQ